MHSDLIEVGWTEEHWNRIYGAVTEEAQKARIGAQVFSLVGPLDRTTVAVPPYSLSVSYPQNAWPRLEVDSNPTLYLTRISANVYLRSRELADPDLNAALTAFRRSANFIARVEDALVMNGRPGPGAAPPFGVAGIPPVFQITGDGAPEGVFPFQFGPGGRSFVPVGPIGPNGPGNAVVNTIIQCISDLEAAGQLGPYACVLSPDRFAEVCAPTASLVLPRDRILPFLQGPLLRSSAIQPSFGAVLALSANPIELVVADDIHVSFLQRTEDATWVFQVSERVALRIKESAAISYFQ
jgi:uncharacterized linocin/CFP29 family protein